MIVWCHLMVKHYTVHTWSKTQSKVASLEHVEPSNYATNSFNKFTYCSSLLFVGLAKDNPYARMDDK